MLFFFAINFYGSVSSDFAIWLIVVMKLIFSLAQRSTHWGAEVVQNGTEEISPNRTDTAPFSVHHAAVLMMITKKRKKNRGCWEGRAIDPDKLWMTSVCERATFIFIVCSNHKEGSIRFPMTNVSVVVSRPSQTRSFTFFARHPASLAVHPFKHTFKSVPKIQRG